MKWNKIIPLLIIIFIGCSDNNSVDPEETTDLSSKLLKLFPYSSDSKYEFSIDTLNIDNSFSRIGTRISEFDSEVNVGEHNIFKCNQVYNYGSAELLFQSRFRSADNSIRLLTDSSRIYELFPDSLRNIIKILVDEEGILIQLPLEKEKRWPVAKAYVDYQSFIFNTVDVEAEYLGSETLLLDAFNKEIVAEKIKYKLDVNIPNIENPFLAQTVTYFAEFWFAEDYGIIKMEGCSFMLNLVGGYPMDFEDLDQISRQTLINIY